MSGASWIERHTDAHGIALAWSERAGDPGTRTIVFLHGLGASSFDFAWLAAHPTLADHHLIRIDAAGHGASARPDTFSYTIEAHADLTAALLREVCEAPVELVGHSMGGSTAIALATRFPELVAGIVVAEPNLNPGAGTLSGHIARQHEERFATRGYPALLCQTRRAAARGDAVAVGFLRSLDLASPIAMHRSAVSLRAERSPTFREQLIALPLPRTLLWGERTPPLHPPIADTTVRQVTIPSAGHQMMVDNPDAFADAVSDTLNQS